MKKEPFDPKKLKEQLDKHDWEPSERKEPVAEWQRQAFSHHAHPCRGETDRLAILFALTFAEGMEEILARLAPQKQFVIEIRGTENYVTYFEALDGAPTGDDVLPIPDSAKCRNCGSTNCKIDDEPDEDVPCAVFATCNDCGFQFAAKCDVVRWVRGPYV